MSIFKNDNEAAFVGGKKHWTDVIKNSGDGNLLIWRQLEEDFNTNSTLIVMPGEQAVFIKGGTVEQVFENGTYKLSTENYPFISRLRNAFSGGVSTFNCVVYFVRIADSREILWGTDSPIAVRDKVMGIRTDVRTRGSYKVRIANPGVFLEKLNGNNVDIQTQDGLYDYFANEFQEKIRSAVSKFLNEYQNELIGLDEHCSEIAEIIQPKINETIADYGLKLVRFTIAALDVDTSKYDAIDISLMEQIAETRRRQGIAMGQKASIDILGADWGRATGAEVLSQIANNPGAGGTAAAGAGLGMGIGAAGAFGSIANAVFAPTVQNMNTAYQDQTGFGSQNTSSGRFDMEDDTPPKSGEKQNGGNEDPVAVLQQLKQLLDAGLIEQSDYDSKKAEILGRM